MNPQKLAGQCGKLKCCLNFETDAYAEASRQLPPRDAVLLTQDAEFYQFKVDILARTITYSTDKHLAANLVTISAARALEIIELNKQGLKVEQLEAEKVKEEPRKEYVEIVGQDSLTRFDKSGKNKKKRKNARPEAKQPKAEPKQQKPAQKQPKADLPKSQPEQKPPKPQPDQKPQKPQQKRQNPRNQNPKPSNNPNPTGNANPGNNGNQGPRRPKRKTNPQKNEKE